MAFSRMGRRSLRQQIVSDSLYASTADTISEQGYKVYYDASKDSIAAINTNVVPQDTTWHKETINGGPSYRFWPK
jgi:hypothetical protein